MAKKKQDNLPILARAMLFKYITGVLYLIGFGFLATSHLIIFTVISFFSFILFIISIYLDMKFIFKTLKGDSN